MTTNSIARPEIPTPSEPRRTPLRCKEFSAFSHIGSNIVLHSPMPSPHDESRTYLSKYCFSLATMVGCVAMWDPSAR